MNLFNLNDDIVLENLSTEELKEMIREANQVLGTNIGDPGYLKTSGKKETLIQEILEAEEFSAEGNTGVVVGNSHHTELSPLQLIVHDGNYRSEVDYFDPQLRTAFRNSDYRFLHNLVVTPSGETDSDGRELYRIVSGNRSFSNWLAVMNEDGQDLQTAVVPVNVRTYSGSARQKHVSEAIEMGQANELQRSMSPVQLMRWYRDLQNAGYTQTQIARLQYGAGNYKNKQAVISVIMGLERLPGRILDLIHFQYHANDLALNGAEFLSTYNIPYTQDGDDIKVVGISMENAKAMMKLYPRRKKGDEEEVERINDFLMNPVILDNAIHMGASAFARDLRNRAIEAGLVEVPALKFAGVEPEQQDADNIEGLVSQPLKVKQASKPDYMDYPMNPDEVVSGLRDKGFKVRDDFQTRLADLIWAGTPGVYEAVLCLLYEGVIVEDF